MIRVSLVLLLLAFFVPLSRPVVGDTPEKAITFAVIKPATPNILSVTVFPDRPYGPGTTQQITVNLLPITETVVTATVRIDATVEAVNFSSQGNENKTVTYRGEYLVRAWGEDVFEVHVSARDIVGNVNEFTLSLRSNCSLADGENQIVSDCRLDPEQTLVTLSGDLVLSGTLLVPKEVTLVIPQGIGVIFLKGGNLVVAQGGEVVYQ